MAVTIPDLWGCIPNTERIANRGFGGAANSGSLFVLKATTDAIFQVAHPLWWEVRLAAYIGNYDIEESTIVIEEQEIDVYLVNRQWMFDVGDCIMAGECSLSEPRCLQFDFYGDP